MLATEVEGTEVHAAGGCDHPLVASGAGVAQAGPGVRVAAGTTHGVDADHTGPAVIDDGPAGYGIGWP